MIIDAKCWISYNGQWRRQRAESGRGAAKFQSFCGIFDVSGGAAGAAKVKKKFPMTCDDEVRGEGETIFSKT